MHWRAGPVLESVRGSVPSPTVAELDWCSAAQRSSHGTFDFVIAADCVYHPELAGNMHWKLQLLLISPAMKIVKWC